MEETHKSSLSVVHAHNVRTAQGRKTVVSRDDVLSVSHIQMRTLQQQRIRRQGGIMWHMRHTVRGNATIMDHSEKTIMREEPDHWVPEAADRNKVTPTRNRYNERYSIPHYKHLGYLENYSEWQNPDALHVR